MSFLIKNDFSAVGCGEVRTASIVLILHLSVDYYSFYLRISYSLRSRTFQHNRCGSCLTTSYGTIGVLMGAHKFSISVSGFGIQVDIGDMQLCGKISRIKSNEVITMRTQGLKTQFITVSAIIFALALFRLLPHWPNVSPIAAMALFGGAYYADRRLAFIVPFVALFLSDLVLGLHNSMIFVYAGFALTVAIGFLLKNKITFTNTAFAVVASSVLFFLLTNFGAWLTSALYAKTAEGLMQAFVAGIPFFQNSLLGNLGYAALIFGGYALMQKNVSALQAR